MSEGLNSGFLNLGINWFLLGSVFICMFMKCSVVLFLQFMSEFVFKFDDSWLWIDCLFLILKSCFW